MSRQSYPVVIKLGEHSRTYQSADQQGDAWQKVLLHAHGKAVVQCYCRPRQSANEGRLSVHCRGDRFHLARFPETGHQHDADCIFYAEDANHSGAGAYRAGVIEELADGGIKIKLKVGLQRLLRDSPTDAPPLPPPGTAKPGKAAMTLLGLLHLLWTNAGLNVWHPRMAGKRTTGLVHYYLRESAKKIVAGRTRVSATLLTAANSPGKDAERNTSIVARALDARNRLLIVAPLAAYRPDLEQNLQRGQLPISGFHGIPYLRMQDGLWSHLNDKYPALSAWRQGAKAMAIIQTDVPRLGEKGHFAEILDVAIMRVTNDWLPVESSYEALVADKLIAANRRFEKPCRYDSDDDTFPDFWLSDMGVEFPMEVWGMDSDEYNARKAEKTAHYQELYGDGWWGWDAASDAEMPALPPPR